MSNRPADTTKRRIVIVGAGFAGLQCVHKLLHPAVSITLIDAGVSTY